MTWTEAISSFHEVALRCVSWMQFLSACRFHFFFKSAAVLWLSPQYHSSRSACRACRETIPDDFLSPGFEVLWYCLRGQIPDSPKLHQTTMVQTTICYHSTTCSRHIVDQKCVFWPKVISGRTTWWQHESFALYWPHPNNPPPAFTAHLLHPIQTIFGESPKSSPHSIKCLCISAGVSMSLQTQRG